MKWSLLVIFALSSSLALAEPSLLTLSEAAKLASKSLSAGKAQVGEVTLLARFKESKDLQLARDTLTKALKAEGLSIIDTVEAKTSFAFTAENKAGARALFMVDAGGGSLYAIPKPATKTLTGLCQKVPARDLTIKVHQSALLQANSLSINLSTTRLIDVDGDAILDAFVPVSKAGVCPDQGSWEVYVMRGGCGYLVGEVGPGALPSQSLLAPLGAGGLRPLTLEAKTSRTSSKGTRELATTTTTFHGVDGVYTKQSATTDAYSCPHCASWYCTSP